MYKILSLIEKSLCEIFVAYRIELILLDELHTLIIGDQDSAEFNKVGLLNYRGVRYEI